MRRTVNEAGLILVAVFAASIWVAAVAAPAAEATGGKRVLGTVMGNTEFALDLYSRLRGEDGNLFISPFSISSALAMTWAGARGETEAEMAEALRFGTSQVALHQAFGHLKTIGAIDEIPLRDQVAAVSCGLWRGEAILDLRLQRSLQWQASFFGAARRILPKTTRTRFSQLVGVGGHV